MVVDRPAPGYDPDRWARRWGTTLGVALLVGAALPSLTTRHYVGFSASVFAWPWEGSVWGSTAPAALFWIPIVLGAAALMVSRILRGRTGAVLLLVIASLGLLGSVLLLGGAARWIEWSSPYHLPEPGLLLVLAVLAPALAVAVGNHVRRGFADSEAARGLAAIGGALTVAWPLVPVLEGRSAISYLVTSREWDENTPLDLGLVALWVLGVLGVASLSRGPSVGRRCRILSILSRTLLYGPPLLVVGLLLAGISDSALEQVDSLSKLAMFVKAFLLFCGHLLLVAVGAAAWLDAAHAARSSLERSDRAPSRTAHSAVVSSDRPVPGPTPDRWTRRWACVCAALLAGGGLVFALGDRHTDFTDATMVRVDAWGGVGNLVLAFVMGGAMFVAAARGRPRGIGIVALASGVAYVVVTTESGHGNGPWPPFGPLGFFLPPLEVRALPLSQLLAASCIAAVTHTLRRDGEWRLPARLGLAAGGLLVVTCVSGLLIAPPGRGYERWLWGDATAQGLPWAPTWRWAGTSLVAGYGLAAMLCAVARGRARRLLVVALRTATYGSVLLYAVGGVVVEHAVHPAESIGRIVEQQLGFDLIYVGRLLLLPLGIAALLEVRRPRSAVANVADVIN